MTNTTVVREDAPGGIARPLNSEEASRYLLDTYNLRYSPNTLNKMATVGGGPAFRKGGRYRLYTANDLDIWAAQRMGPRVFSTAGYATAAA